MFIKNKQSPDADSHRNGLGSFTMIGLIILILGLSILVVYISQALVEKDAFVISPAIDNGTTPKEQYEIAKLAAEIRQIRSDTSGSLFWLKLIALFVTVGSAVGGYLIGQSRTTRAHIEFEDRKNVDSTYQAMVQELADDSPLLRAAAVVKLGMILRSIPHEWNVGDARKAQIIELTKQVLATSLSIEKEDKVLKTLSSAIIMHHPWEFDKNSEDKKKYGDLRGLDLSGAMAKDAYWARVDFTYADMYHADLSEASLRKSILIGTQFRETNLSKAILIEANCEGANFKLADLRYADLSGANLVKANFEGAKVFGVKIANSQFGENPDVEVDISSWGDLSQMMPCSKWLETLGSAS